MQPLIAPLFGGRSLLEFVARLTRYELTEPYEIAKRVVCRADRSRASRPRLSTSFCTMVSCPADKRLLEDVEFDRERSSAQLPQAAFQVKRLKAPKVAISSSPSILTRVCLTVVSPTTAGCRRFRIRSPSSLGTTRALISPDTAQRLGLSTGDIVRLIVEKRSLEIPVLVAPGQADRSLSVALGYGRTHAGRVGNDVGFNAYVLRTSTFPVRSDGVKIENTGRVHEFACTQSHWALEGRDLVREYPLANLSGS